MLFILLKFKITFDNLNARNYVVISRKYPWIVLAKDNTIESKTVGNTGIYSETKPMWFLRIFHLWKFEFDCPIKVHDLCVAFGKHFVWPLANTLCCNREFVTANAVTNKSVYMWFFLSLSPRAVTKSSSGSLVLLPGYPGPVEIMRLCNCFSMTLCFLSFLMFFGR